jgi:hypothetical protein
MIPAARLPCPLARKVTSVTGAYAATRRGAVREADAKSPPIRGCGVEFRFGREAAIREA